jgi:5-methylcytosine-specific restriction endonuclease McrA
MTLCPYCQTPLTSARRVQCGAADCLKAYHRDRNRTYQQAYRAEYASRGESYRGQWGWRTYSGSRQRYPERNQAQDDRRRARKNSVPHERFQRKEIYLRDGWVCQLCKLPVDKALKFPDLMSASLDHVIPIVRGGAHTRQNSQLAHLGCNLAKGAKLITEEVRP